MPAHPPSHSSPPSSAPHPTGQDGGGPAVQWLVALDLEGVLTQEIWPAIGRELGIDAFAPTTREVDDYGALVQQRLTAMRDNGLLLSDLIEVVESLRPLPGATRFLDRLRDRCPVVVLSDTFEQLVRPLLAPLGHPLVLCHRFRLDGDRIVGADLRAGDAKRRAVEAFQGLGYRVAAVGDGLNDLNMLAAADRGCLLDPPPGIVTGPAIAIEAGLDGVAAWIDRETETGDARLEPVVRAMEVGR